MKRVMLALAQSVPVVDAVTAGWKLYAQEKVMEGALTKCAFLPTCVGAPGLSISVNPEAMPIGIVDKVYRGYKKLRCNLETPVSFQFSMLEGAVDITEVDGWYKAVPNQAIDIHKDDVICYVMNESGAQEPVLFPEHADVEMQWVRWRFVMGLSQGL
jgi:hypothetical protein